MKKTVVLLSLALAASMANTAYAAKAKHHHAAATTASTTDWPGNTYFDLNEQQRAHFFQDAMNPAGAKW